MRPTEKPPVIFWGYNVGLAERGKIMTTKNGLIMGAILALLLFIGGLVSGYYWWGKNGDETADYKALLKDTIKYIASLKSRFNCVLKAGPI